MRKPALIDWEWVVERKRVTRSKKSLPWIKSEQCAQEAERQIDGVGNTDKERAIALKQGDCKRPLHNKEDALHANLNVDGDICD